MASSFRHEEERPSSAPGEGQSISRQTPFPPRLSPSLSSSRIPGAHRSDNGVRRKTPPSDFNRMRSFRKQFAILPLTRKTHPGTQEVQGEAHLSEKVGKTVSPSFRWRHPSGEKGTAQGEGPSLYVPHSRGFIPSSLSFRRRNPSREKDAAALAGPQNKGEHNVPPQDPSPKGSHSFKLLTKLPSASGRRSTQKHPLEVLSLRGLAPGQQRGKGRTLSAHRDTDEVSTASSDSDDGDLSGYLSTLYPRDWDRVEGRMEEFLEEGEEEELE